MAPLVEAAIDSDPYIWDKSLHEKFEKLIYQPLSMLNTIASKINKVVVVIDALDECEKERDNPEAACTNQKHKLDRFPSFRD